MTESLQRRLARDLGGLYQAPEAAGEIVHYLPHGAVDAVAVRGVFGYVESSVKVDRDGQGHVQEATFGPVSLVQVAPRARDTLTRFDGTTWMVVGLAAHGKGFAILRLEQYDQVERSRPGFREMR